MMSEESPEYQTQSGAGLAACAGSPSAGAALSGDAPGLLGLARDRDYSSLTPYYQDASCVIYNAHSERVIPMLSGMDAVITDPPYSSGGQYRGDRSQKTSTKYVNSDSNKTCRVEFSGDNRDQRAFLAWASMWLRDCHAASKPGSVLMMFTDWRQLPTMTDAIQCGGWVWRNLVTWWKPGVRMQRGRFSSSAEYILYASIGVPDEGEKSLQNVLEYQPVSGEDKDHVAEKPLELMRKLVSVTPAGAWILDPFMGSGTTLVAAKELGRRAIGIEIDERSCEIAARRLQQECLNFAPAVADPAGLQGLLVPDERANTNSAQAEASQMGNVRVSDSPGETAT